MSLEDFIEKKLVVSAPSKEDLEAGSEVLNPVAEAGMTLVGVAAVSLAQSGGQAMSTPSKEQKCVGAIASDNSSHQLPAAEARISTPTATGSTPSNSLPGGGDISSPMVPEASGSDGGGTSIAVEDVDDDTPGAWLRRELLQTTAITIHPLLLQALARGELMKWKNKMSISSILAGSQDLRALTGLKKCYERKMRKEDSQMEGLQLKAFHDICAQAAVLGPQKVFSASEDDLMKTLKMVQQENVTVPPQFKLNIFTRRMNKLQTQREYASLRIMLSPWEEKPWDGFNPTLVAAQTNSVKRMALVKQCAFEKVLGPLILKGEDQSATVMSICTCSLKEAEVADPVLLDNVAAVTLDESTTIWQALEQTKRLKNSAGQDSALAGIANAVANSPWYAQRLSEYLEKSSALVEHGYKVGEYMTALESLSLAQGDLQKIYDIAKDIPKLAVLLRSGSCDDLFAKLKVSGQRLWDEMKVAEKPKHDIVALMSRILQEVATTFPLEASFSLAIDECGSMLNKAGQEAQVQEFMDCCAKLLNLPQNETDVFLQTVEANHESLSPMRLKGCLSDDLGRDVVQKTTKHIIDFVMSIFKKYATLPEKLELCMQYLSLLQPLVQDNVHVKLSNAVQACHSVIVCYWKVQDSLEKETISEQALFDAVQLLHRRQLRFKDEVTKLVEQPEDTSKPVLQEWGSKAETLVTQQQTELVAKSLLSLQSAYKHLADIAGGQSGGRSWMDTFKGQNWEQLLEHAAGSILLIHGPDLVERLKSLQEAIFYVCT
eukprot:290724-Amphidinium_carterae.2